MPHELCLLTGIYPPDVGGPANFAEAFCRFRRLKTLSTSIITYTDSRDFQKVDDYISVSATSRQHKILPRYIRTIRLLRREISKKSNILANGCFVEIAFLRFFITFRYTVKIPGDIVWERAKNSGITKLGIDDFQFQKLPIRYKMFKYLFHRSLRKANVVIAPSSHLGSLALSWGVKTENLRIIHNSIELSQFKFRRDALKKYDFVTLCRLVKWKKVDEIIEAVSKTSASLLIIGDGPEREKLELLSSKFPNEIHFVGNLQKSKVPDALSSCRYFLLNSDFEATSYALMESMALGLVPVSREDTGSVEVIDHLVDGILCGVGTGYSLNRAVRELAEGQLNTETLSNNARVKIEAKFNSNINFQEILDCCE